MFRYLIEVTVICVGLFRNIKDLKTRLVSGSGPHQTFFNLAVELLPLIFNKQIS